MSGWQSDVARSNRIDKLRQHLNTEHNISDDTIDAIIRDAGSFRGETSLIEYHDDLHLPTVQGVVYYATEAERWYTPSNFRWKDNEPSKPQPKRLDLATAHRRRRLVILTLALAAAVGWAYEVDHRWDGDERPSVGFIDPDARFDLSGIEDLRDHAS